MATIAAELDSEAVRLELRQFALLLVNSMRERDDALAADRQIEAELAGADRLRERRKVALLRVRVIVARMKKRLGRNERELHALPY